MMLEQVRAAARNAFREQIATTLPMELRQAIEVGVPMPVHHYQAADQIWYVPLRAQGREVGFAQFDAGLALLRYGMWVDRLDAIGSLPPATTELREEEVIRRAQAYAGARGKLLAPPELVFQGFQTRIGWACRFGDASGGKTVFVTPEYVWSDSP